jgi:CheY-like chemotaxis protein
VRVLVIDDDAAVRRAMERTLKGHEVTTCESATSALALLSATGPPFDAILCDVRMPGMDGPAFYERLETLRPDLLGRVAFMTGDAGGRGVRDFLASTGRIVIEKPFTTASLEAVLRVLGG